MFVPDVPWLALAALASGAPARTFTIRADGTGDRPGLGAALVPLAPPDPFDADSPIVEPGLLDADPRFCGPLGGDCTLGRDSPCGPAGPFGPTGARGVACAPTASAPEAPRGTGLTLDPNPAHGPVAFAMPAAAGAWSVEVFAAAGETLRGEGQGESGRVAPGVHLARDEAGGAREARRFVWLGRLDARTECAAGPPAGGGARRGRESGIMRIIRRWAALAAWVSAALVVRVPVAGAGPPLVVAADGSGDVRTIAAAIDTMRRGAQTDSIILMPGHYDEMLGREVNGLTLWAPGGPTVTSVRGLVLPETNPFYGCAVSGSYEGLRFLETVKIPCNNDRVRWKNCIFEEGLVGQGDYWPGVIEDCTFRGPTRLDYQSNVIRNCVFESAPLFVRNGIGGLFIENCTFKGPADTLVVVRVRDDSGIIFRGCRFEGARVAIEGDQRWGGSNTLWFDRCAFEDVDVGITAPVRRIPTIYFLGLHFGIKNSTFRNFGSAVRLDPAGRTTVSLERIDLTGARGAALDLHVNHVRLEDVMIAGSAEEGARIRLRPSYGGDMGGGYWPGGLEVSGATVAGNAGHGLSVTVDEDSTLFEGSVVVRDSRFERNRGHGLRVVGTQVLLERNVASGNDSAGIGVDLRMWQTPVPVCSVRSNTVVGHGADGIVVRDRTATANIIVERNIVARSVGAGVRLGVRALAVARWNDLWSNAGGAVAGPIAAVENLDVNPLFCDESAGDFALASGSPCAPGGAYGQIGASGVGRGAPLTAPAQAASRLALGPNPALGEVRFTVPAGAGPARLEVFDLAGRRLWAREGAGGEVRWSGEARAGVAPAGVYLVRVSGAHGAESRRFVWLGR
uniref:Right handed beta helix domain-containing protein n=1 Tax=Eiseniibacteriota bacterium TaxID=2212470 RepID=A0A832MKF7_UNCEI